MTERARSSAAAGTQAAARRQLAAKRTRPPDLHPPRQGIDRGRVEEIRRAIAEGRYPVDPERIAERIIELGLLSDR
jgi:negative regulator of flagellin synthesis FlgM